MKLRSRNIFIAGLSTVAVLAGSFSPALSKCLMKDPLFGFDVYMEDKYCPKKEVKKKKADKKKTAKTTTPNATARQKPRPVVVTKRSTAPKSEKRIAEMQTMLTAAGYNPGPADGLNGPMTREAAAKFNVANDLPKKASIGSTNAVLRAQLAPKPDLRVVEMQKRLSSVGYYSGPADGFMGPETKKAAAEFNVANDLPKKASIGSTNAVLMDQLAPKPDLRVVEMQKRLSRMGYYSGPADGSMGPETKKAAAKFNVAHDLPKKASTPSTLAVLRSMDRSGDSSSMAMTADAPKADSEIREMQSLLTGLGYQPGPATGIAGPETKSARNKFLSNMGVSSSTSTANTIVLLHRISGT